MDVIHFPDDPRPATWPQPVLALGHFDGLHRGHVKLVERNKLSVYFENDKLVSLTGDIKPAAAPAPAPAPAATAPAAAATPAATAPANSASPTNTATK